MALAPMGRYDGQISPKSQDLFSGNVDPNKAVLRFSFEAFLRVFQLSTTHKWGEFHAKTGVAISDRQFLRLSTHFTSFHFT